jgi:hypothetical protein
MGATVLMYTDRHAATIVKVDSGIVITIQEDKSIRTDTNGMSDTQSYRYEPNTQAIRRRFSLRINGRWVEVGSDMNNGTTLLIGERDTYHDYGF